MAWYDGTYSCGHDGRVNVIGPGKDRQWKIDRHFSGLCPECWEQKKQEEREKANAEAAEKAKEMELPALTGTEKQVSWANTLRQTFIDKTGKIENRYFEAFCYCEGFKDLNIKDVPAVVDYILRTKSSASFWIDNRGKEMFVLCQSFKEAIKSDDEIIAEQIEAEIKQESTVLPENCKYKEAAEIMVSDEKITVSFPKNDDFREVVKSLGYIWGNIYWYRKITKFNGPAIDRAAELGNKLLNAGFPITITDNSILQSAVSGNYQLEQKRWVSLQIDGTYKGWLSIFWGAYDDDLYDIARKLPGSKWSNSAVVVKVNYWQEVEDFAGLYGFKFSDGALEAIETYKSSLKNIQTVTPAEIVEEKPVDGLKEILKSGDEILDDLKD